MHIKEVQEALCVPEAAPCTNCTTLSTVWRSCTSEAMSLSCMREVGAVRVGAAGVTVPVS